MVEISIKPKSKFSSVIHKNNIRLLRMPWTVKQFELGILLSNRPKAIHSSELFLFLLTLISNLLLFLFQDTIIYLLHRWGHELPKINSNRTSFWDRGHSAIFYMALQVSFCHMVLIYLHDFFKVWTSISSKLEVELTLKVWWIQFIFFWNSWKEILLLKTISMSNQNLS